MLRSFFLARFHFDAAVAFFSSSQLPRLKLHHPAIQILSATAPSIHLGRGEETSKSYIVRHASERKKDQLTASSSPYTAPDGHTPYT